MKRRKDGGAPEALRSDDSICPLSAGVVVTEMTTTMTTASTNSRVSNKKHKRRSNLLCGLGPSRDDEEDSSDDGRGWTKGDGKEAESKEDGREAEPWNEAIDQLVLTPFSDWMGALPYHAHDLPFNQIAIPGSHDSCTASLDRDGGLHPDAPELYRDVLRLFGSWAKTVAHRWSQTQDRTFVEQLQLGIRYFDLRISVRPGYKELFLVHGFYGDSVTTCLTSICSWLDSHPREIVLLDMNHFHGLTDTHHQKLVDDIENIFGDKLVPVLEDAGRLTLARMWKDNQQVILFYHHVKSGISTPNTLQPTINYLWPGSMIPSPWPRTTRIKDLIDFLDKSTFSHNNTLNHSHSSSTTTTTTTTSTLPRCRQRTSFFVSQGVLTPTVYTVLGHVTSSLKDHFAQSAAQAVVEWLKGRHHHYRKTETTTANNVGVDGDGTATAIYGSSKDVDAVVVEESGGSGGGRVSGSTNAVNVVIVDFVDLDPSYVESVVKLNYARDVVVEHPTDPPQTGVVAKDPHHHHMSVEMDGLKQLAPVVEIIQHQQSANQSLQADPPPTSSSKFLTHSSNNTAKLIGYQNLPSDLAPPTHLRAEDASSALSSRALTPTPLQFIDAGNNSPSGTPVRVIGSVVAKER